MPPAEPETEVLCQCSGATAKQLGNLYRRGAITLELLMERTGVCLGCGSCEDDVREWLEAQASGPGGLEDCR